MPRGIDADMALDAVCAALPAAHSNVSFWAGLDASNYRAMGLNVHMPTRFDDLAQTFTVSDVGILILEAVPVLHARGHQRFRVLPAMSTGGVHGPV